MSGKPAALGALVDRGVVHVDPDLVPAVPQQVRDVHPLTACGKNDVLAHH
jgi:hypothetical protein